MPAERDRYVVKHGPKWAYKKGGAVGSFYGRANRIDRMTLHVFISYSHADEKHLERLHKHLAMLKREDLIEDWSDHEIIPGDNIGQEIDRALAVSGLFIALVSPDYLASKYCYEKEFKQALAMAEAGRLRIVPVILDACDWKSSPFSQFLALPKDGKPVAEWTNANVAYLDVVLGLRRVISADAPNGDLETKSSSPSKSAWHRRMKVKQEFDAIQRREFTDQAFGLIRDYFRNSCAELNSIEDLKARFEAMSDTAFTCTIVNRGLMQGRGEAHITVRSDKGRHYLGDITYVYQAHAEAGTSNGSASVQADDYNLYLTLDDFMQQSKHKYDARQVAEKMWSDFARQAGIEVDDDA